MGQVHVEESGARTRKARRTGVRAFSLFVSGKPHPKERPRFNKATGFVYTPDKTRKAEQSIKELWENAGGPTYPANVPLSVEIHLTRDGTAVVVTPLDPRKIELRGDIDNYTKTVLDGLNVMAWADDKQVVELKVVKD